MVAPVHNIDPKILPEESAKLQLAGREAGDLIFQPLWSNGKKKALDVGGPSSIDFIVERLYCKRPIQGLASSKILTPTPSLPGECVPPEGRIRRSEAAMDEGGARSAPFGVAMSSERRVRAAHGRARAAKTH